MSVVHGFRLKNGDHELEKILTGMSGKEKSDFIREALYFYIRYGDKINRIDDIYSGIQEILSRLDGMSTGQSVCAKRDKKDEDKGGEGERILRESVMELINL